MSLMDYSQLINCKYLSIPEGNVKKIVSNGQAIWYSADNFNGYQPVEWIGADKDVKAYIDLGFAFDTAATIYIEQFLDNAPQFLASYEETYIFGAANSTGVYRCMLTSPGNAYGTFIYGSNGSTYTSCHGKYIYAGKNRLKIVQKAGNAYWENLDTGEVSTKQTGNIAYTMTDNMYLLAQNYKGNARFNNTKGHSRKVGRFSYYDKNDTLICDLYPCYHKLTGVIGMYDVVRNIFLTNVGTGSFTKGADIAENIIHTVGYKENTRISTSDGVTEKALSGYVTTGMITLPDGYILNTSGINYTNASYSSAYIYRYNPNTEAYITCYKDSQGTLGTSSLTVANDGDGNIVIVNSMGSTAKLRLVGYGLGINLIVNIAPMPNFSITFTIDGTEYQAEEGMTWAEWCESEYNTCSGSIINNMVTISLYEGNHSIIYNVMPDDEIISGTSYIFASVGFDEEEL